MDGLANTQILASHYDRSQCEVGVVHLGFGAFHRAHQAVYLDAYMAKTNDLRWGVAAVNLRASESESFANIAKEINHFDGYFVKSISADNVSEYSKVRAHVQFCDWARDAATAEALLSASSVKLVTITVTESGYYTDPNGHLDIAHSLIASELAGGEAQSVYGYLRSSLKSRMTATSEPLTIACCDNIRQNGKMLERNLLAYLNAFGDTDLIAWVKAHCAFPCSMVDRITPRPPESLCDEMSQMVLEPVISPIMCEDYIQWVIADTAASDMPDLAQVGVTVTKDVDPYEETKIRVLNGGHTALAYLGALEGLETFDEIMVTPHLKAHFDRFETEEVLPAITLDLPFAKEAYQDKTATRFGNQAIGDTIARICADGMAKFPIFIRPTIEGCFAQGIVPSAAIHSIASWHVFATHVAQKKIPFAYVEPSWDKLSEMLGTQEFLTSEQLWGDIPQTYPEFISLLRQAIADLEEKWPV